MNIFFAIFFIGIVLYFLAALSSLLFAKNKSLNMVSMVISIAASVFMLIAVFAEYKIYHLDTFEINMFGALFDPLKMLLKVDIISIMFLMVMSISSIIITVYIYTATQKGEIKIAYHRSNFLSNLFMMILSFMIFANNSYFLTFLISCAVLLVFIMLASDFTNKEAAAKATTYLIWGNIAAILITIAYSIILKESGMLTINGFEVALMPYNMSNITFIMIMVGVIILLSLIPRTNYNHVRLLINGLFSKIILLVLFRFVINLYSANISLLTILVLLAISLSSALYNSYKASVTIEGYKWLRYVDLALNSICFVSIVFSLYADNLGYYLISEQIRNSTMVMILCSIFLYPAIAIIIHNLDKIDKSKRFKLLALTVFVPKALLPPIGGFAGIFVMISNISALLDIENFSKTILLIASAFGLIYVYLLYVYAHMKFFINVIDSGYEPEEIHSKRKISKMNFIILAFSVFLTFITGIIPTFLGYGISILYSSQVIVTLIANVIIMLVLVYFMNATQMTNTLKSLQVKNIKEVIAKEGLYHIVLKAVSFVFLIVGGTFYSVSNSLVLDGVKSYSVLGVMYIILSVFLLYDKDIDFKDLYVELYMMLIIILDSVTYPAGKSIPMTFLKILLAIVYIVIVAFAFQRQRFKIKDTYDRILSNARMYLYIAFFLTFFAVFDLPFGGLWGYVLYIAVGLVLFVITYIVISIVSIFLFKKKIYRKIIGNFKRMPEK